MSKGKWYRGERPWERFGLTKSQYYYRLKNNLPFERKIHREKTDDILKMFPDRPAKNYGRYSGQNYENSPERIARLKKQYKNGVPDQIINDWIGVNQ